MTAVSSAPRRDSVGPTVRRRRIGHSKPALGTAICSCAQKQTPSVLHMHAPTRSQPAQAPALTAGARCAHRSATESRTRAPMPCACPAAAPPPVHTDTERGYSLTSCKIDGSEQTCRSHAELQAGGGMGSIAAGADPPHAEGAKLDQAQILKSQIYSDHIYLMY